MAGAVILIVSQDKKFVVFFVNQRMADFLWENRIFFSLEASRARLKGGNLLTVPRLATVEPYVTFNAGLLVSSLGGHSFTSSAVKTHIKAGRHCSIAPGLRLSGFEHPVNALTTGLFAYDRQVYQMTQYMEDAGVARLPAATPVFRFGVELEHDVWVGADVWIRQGVKIGTGAIVAANAVVTKDVPPYAVVGGNPARILKMRFPDELTRQLLASQWWRLELSHLSKFPFTDAASFIRAYEREGGADLPAWEPTQFRLAEELAALC